MSIKVLVTGSNGQLGKTINELHRKWETTLEFNFVSKEKLDISNQKEINQYFEKNNFDYCINCAAYTNVEQAEKTPEFAYKINADGVKYLAEACKNNNVILIHISTDYVFDGEKKTPYTPEDIPNPINEYGKSKLLGEQHIQEILSNYYIIRTSWLYSKKYGKNFYRTIVEKAQKEKKLFITTKQIGCPTNTVNLTHYIFDLINQNNKNYGIYHFCDGKAMTWFEFAEHILSENHLKNKTNLVKASDYVTFAKRPKNSILLS